MTSDELVEKLYAVFRTQNDQVAKELARVLIKQMRRDVMVETFKICNSRFKDAIKAVAYDIEKELTQHKNS